MALGDIVQVATDALDFNVTPTLAADPTVGNTLFWIYNGSNAASGPDTGAWTMPEGAVSSFNALGGMAYKLVEPGDPRGFHLGGGADCEAILIEVEGIWTHQVTAELVSTDPAPIGPTVVGASVTPTPVAGKAHLIVGGYTYRTSLFGPPTSCPAPWTFGAAAQLSVNLAAMVFRYLGTGASGSYAPEITALNAHYTADDHNYGAQTFAMVADVVVPPITPGPVPGVYDYDDVFLADLPGAFDVKLRAEKNGVGSGSFKIRANDPDATATNLRQGNFVRVPIPQIDPDAILGFFLEDGDFDLVSQKESGGEVLSFQGKGTLSYATRAIWLAESFLVDWWPAYKEAEAGPPGASDIGALALAGDPGWYYHYTVSGSTVTGKTLFHTGAVTAYYDQRRLFTRADGSKITLVHFSDTVYAGFWVHPFGAGVVDYRKKSVYAFGNSVLMSSLGTGTKPGETLRAMYDETQAAGRPINPWPLMTVDFTDTLDSNGNAWTTTDALAAVSAELGDDFLSTIAKLIGTGVLDVDMGPDFLLHAYNAPYGRDLASATFAAGKVRFEKGVNIADDLVRETNDDRPVGTFAEAVGNEDGAIGRALLPTASDWRPREIPVRGETADTTSLEELAAAELAFRLLHFDSVAFNVNTPIVGAENELAGLYLPGPRWTAHGNYWVGDFVRLHTGTGENDFNEETLEVAAITISFTEANDLRVVVELISTIGGADSLGFSSGGDTSGGGSSSGVTSGGSSSTASDLYQPIADRDRPNGYPSLDENGKVPFTELDLDWHPSVRAAATGNVTLATLDAGDALDGVTLAEGDDVLLPAQTTGSENGLYTIQASGTAPTRRGDFDDSPDVVGAVVLVREGTVNEGTIWRSTNLTDPTIGSTALTFEQISVSVSEILDIPTAETDTTLVLAPDGLGGVEFRAETGGGGGGGVSVVVPGLPTGPLLRSYTFDSTIESWTTSAGTLTASGAKARLAHTSNAVALEPSGASNVADGEVEADLSVVAGAEASLVFRATDASNFYMFTVAAVGASPQIALYKCVAGSFTALASSSPALLTGLGAFRSMVRFVGSRLECYVNGTLIFVVVDATYSTGRVGARTFNGTLDIDNVRVYGTPDLLTGNVGGGGNLAAPSAVAVDLGAASLLTRRAVVNAEDDLFDASSLAAKWLALTHDDATVDLTARPGWCKITAGGGKLQAVPAGDWTIETEVILGDAGAAIFQNNGLVLGSSQDWTAGTFAIWGIGESNSLQLYRYVFEKFVNGAFSSTYSNDTFVDLVDHLFLRINKTGTTYTVEYSSTGWTWHRFFQTASLGFTPTHFGIIAADVGALFNSFHRY